MKVKCAWFVASVKDGVMIIDQICSMSNLLSHFVVYGSRADDQDVVYVCVT